MKKTLYFISAFLLLGIFTSCEKFELDDHCPEENQEPYVNPQELRINDDSDSEEGGRSNLNSWSEESHHGVGNSVSTSEGGENPEGNPDDEDGLINDDSDNEDEGGRPRNPNGTEKSPK